MNTTFVERLQQEKVELDEKIEKLRVFLESQTVQLNIDAVQFSLLTIQYQIMCSYSQVLLERIIRL